MRQVLIKPLLTEKMNALSETGGKFGFIVDYDSNKIQIAKAVEDKFNVKVKDVNTIKYDGKTKTQFRKSGRFTGKTSRFKKAIVTLEKGQKIDLFEQVQ
jgi:large subunit ribosomal protein L23